MANNPVPTLSTTGWVHSTKNRLDVMFADFCVAAHSQYPMAKIETSLPWLVVKHQGHAINLANDVANTLKSYFETQFTAVAVTCIARDNETRADMFDLHISAQVTDEAGLVYSLDEIRTVGENRTLAFAAVNNGSLPSTGN